MTNFRLLQIESICRQELNKPEIMNSVFNRTEIVVGNGENAVYQHFLLYPQCFEKSIIIGIVKFKVMWG